jgi:hypothetical protein
MMEPRLAGVAKRWAWTAAAATLLALGLVTVAVSRWMPGRGTAAAPLPEILPPGSVPNGPPAAPAVVRQQPGGAVVLAAGDIARCDRGDDEATAALLDSVRGTVLALGDQAYPAGSASDFRRCYGASWGRHRARTHPTPGNHEYAQPGAGPYFDYFGAAAGPRGRGWYSFEVGAWHVVSLNSNVATGAGSVQEQWLREDLRRHPSVCILAFWHHPRYSSGLHGPTPAVAPLWRALQEAHAAVVLQGHDHGYERFGRMDAAGREDAGGIRSFVAGTGGATLRPFGRQTAGSRVRIPAHGVLKLTLRADSYAWEFIEAGGGVADRGESACRPAGG